MPLNDLIMRRNSRESGAGLARRVGGTFVGRGVRMIHQGLRPLRINQSSSFKIAKSFSSRKDKFWRHGLIEDSMVSAGLEEAEVGTKLYISNLDYGVSNEDIKELFSEVGDLKHYTTHYDRNGCPSGSAEVVYKRRSDAIAALKRYNNVQLDGKPIKIEIIGHNLGLSVAPRVNVVGGVNGRGKRTVVMTPEFGRGALGSTLKQVAGWNHESSQGENFVTGAVRRRSLRRRVRGRGNGRARNRLRSGKLPTRKTAADLDKELENYHAEATNLSL